MKTKRPSKVKKISIDELQQALIEELQICKLGKDHHLFRSSENWGWKFAELLEGYHTTFIDFTSAWSFLIEEINASVKGLELPKEPDFLENVIGKENLGTLKSDIINKIKSIPRRYDVYVPIDGHLSEEELVNSKEIILSKNISIISMADGDARLSLKIPPKNQFLASRNSLWSLMKSKDMTAFFPNRVYLKFLVIGFFQDSNTNSAIQAAISELKTSLYIGLLEKIFEKGKSAGRVVNAIICDYDKGARKPTALSSLPLPANLSEVISGFKIAPATLDPIKKIGLLKDASKQDHVSKIRTLLDKNLKTETERILASLEWAFDSLAAENENETVSFILLCIAIEALMGEEERASDLTNLLANRIAYLLGRNRRHRKDLVKYTKEMFQVRGNIVHGRNRKLEKKHKAYLGWGRSILDKILTKEIELTIKSYNERQFLKTYQKQQLKKKQTKT